MLTAGPSGLHGRTNLVDQCFPALADLHVNETGRMCQAIEVVRHKQWHTVVRSKYFVYRVSIQKTSVHDWNAGFF